MYIVVHDGRTDNPDLLEKWLIQKQNFGGDSPVLVLVNEWDKNRNYIDENRLKEKYNVASVVRFSIQDDVKELALFQQAVIDLIKQQTSWQQNMIPANYYAVKQELEERFTGQSDQSQQDLISLDTFREIAASKGVVDEKPLLSSLHALGIGLWYEDLENINTLVLNPEWISEGVYDVINWLNKKGSYQIDINDFAIVFAQKRERYPQSQDQFLFNLIQHYELAYKHPQHNVLVIPYLLHNKGQPEQLPVCEAGKGLKLRYRSEQPFPIDVISRFIVRHYTLICNDDIWKYGVILENANGNTALVREDDRTLEVSIIGGDTDSRRDFLDQLRESINAIFADYQSTQPEREYRIYYEETVEHIRRGDLKRDGLWLSEDTIAGHVANDKPFFDTHTNRDMDLASFAKFLNLQVNMQPGAILNMAGQQHNQFNYKDCNIGMQGALNDLAEQIDKHPQQAEELRAVAATLEQAETIKDKNQLKKQGMMRGVKRVLSDLADKESTLHKTVKGVRHGVEIAQELAEQYNNIAQWAGLPQVPGVFLKE